MKNSLLFTFLVCLINSQAQIKIGAGAFYSSPLDQFCIDDYNTGGGVEMDFGVILFNDSLWKERLEISGNWKWGVGKGSSTNLNIGQYELSNKFYHWNIKANLIEDFGWVKPYIGVHAGAGNYYTNEFLQFNEVQFDGSRMYNEDLYRNRTFQFGGQLGAYFQLTKRVWLDLGLNVTKGDSKIKFINFESFTFDGEEIDYKEVNSKPFLVFLNGKLSICLGGGDKGNRYEKQVTSYNPTNDAGYVYPSNNTSTSTPYYYYPSRNTNCSGSTKGGGSSSGSSIKKNHHYKKGKSKLVKKGKTPVGYK